MICHISDPNQTSFWGWTQFESVLHQRDAFEGDVNRTQSVFEIILDETTAAQ